MYWIIRLTALTDPTAPHGAIGVNEEILEQSLAILDGEGRVIGGAFNETMPPFDVEPPVPRRRPVLRHRHGDLGAGLRRAWRPGCGGADGPLRTLPGVPEGVRRRQGQPPPPGARSAISRKDTPSNSGC